MNEAKLSNRWSNLQTYGFAVICLLLGTATGYFMHPSKPAPVASVPQARSRIVNNPMPNGMPTPEQMEMMADKQVAPMLAELQKTPKDPSLMLQIATEYFNARQFVTAAGYFERVVKIKPTVEGYVGLAGACYYSGQGDRAFAALNHALALDPKSESALFDLGLLDLQARNDPKGAVDTWQRLIKYHPQYPQRARVERMIAQAMQGATSASRTKTD